MDIVEPNATQSSGRNFEILLPDSDGGDPDKIILQASSEEDASHWCTVLKKLKEAPVASSSVADSSGQEGGTVAMSTPDDEASDAVEETKYMVRQARSSIYVVNNEDSARPISLRAQSRKEPKKTKATAVSDENVRAKGEVSSVHFDALKSASVGKERDVRRRCSITARKCWLPGCTISHYRDSPFCHEHASNDKGALKSKIEGVSELEEEISKAVERKLDHVQPLTSEQVAEGESIIANFHADLKTEFQTAQGGAEEVARLKLQFDSLFDGNNDGRISAQELIDGAKRIGDVSSSLYLSI